MCIYAGNALAVTRVDSARSGDINAVSKTNYGGAEKGTEDITLVSVARTNTSGSQHDDIEESIPGSVPAVQQEKPQYSKVRLIALVLTVTGAAFLNTFGVQSAVIVLPTIGRDLNILDSRQQWILSAYSLTFGCFLLLSGRLADIYGKRLIFFWGSAWLTVTTMALPFVGNEIGFDVMRGLQGLGAAANVATAIGILGVTFPPGKAKNYAFACYGGGAPLGALFGNIVGGIIGEYLTWKWIFWILSVLAALVTAAGIFVIPPPPINADRAISAKTEVDWIGATLITVGLMVLMFALTEGNVVGWTTPWVPTVIAAGIILIGLFVLWQHHLETRTSRCPLMKISIFANMRFSAAMVIMALAFTAFNNYLIFATYFFQNYLGLSVMQTTLRFIPTGVCGILVTFTTGYILSHIPGNFILLFGTLSTTLSVLLFAAPIPPNTTYWAYGFPAMILCVFGVNTVYPCLTLFTAKSLPQQDQALSGALINAVGQVGRAIGLAIATAVKTAVIAQEKGTSVATVGGQNVAVGDEALLAGLRAAEWFSFGMGVAAVVTAGAAFRGAGYIGKRN